jgi:hypothetical protein
VKEQGMGTDGASAATARHVALVALEALLVAAIVWIAAMTLAGINESGGGIAGTANAGRANANLTVPDGAFGGTTEAHANPGGAGTWVHATCMRGGEVAMVQWARVDGTNHATLQLGPTPTWSSGGAACTAEEGYFASNGRWRVQDTTTFTVTP